MVCENGCLAAPWLLYKADAVPWVGNGTKSRHKPRVDHWLRRQSHNGRTPPQSLPFGVIDRFCLREGPRSYKPLVLRSPPCLRHDAPSRYGNGEQETKLRDAGKDPACSSSFLTS